MLNKAYDISFIKLLTEEPLFLLLNILLTKVFFVSNELLPHIYVFFISFIFSFYIIKKSYNLNFLILSILMLLTVSLSFHAQLVVLRQSLATSILLIFICNKYNLNKLIFISFICALIHNSFFILLLFFLMIRYTNNDIKKNKIIFISIFISLIATTSFYVIAHYIQIRQVNYLSSNNGNSGSGLILWGTCLLVILLKNRYIKNISIIDSLSIFGLFFYIINYYFLPIGGRLLITFIPFIFISLTSGFYHKKTLYLILIFNMLFIISNIYKLNDNTKHNSLNSNYQIYNLIGS